MECKSRSYFFTKKSESEIIETYWNVNFEPLWQQYNRIIRNNRNILECKLTAEELEAAIDAEIIETYWNVNFCTDFQDTVYLVK